MPFVLLRFVQAALARLPVEATRQSHQFATSLYFLDLNRSQCIRFSIGRRSSSILLIPIGRTTEWLIASAIHTEGLHER
jgi:hypothetical protein